MRFVEHRTTRIILSFALFGVVAFLAMAFASSPLAPRAGASRSLATREMATLLGGDCEGCAQKYDTTTCVGPFDACTDCTAWTPGPPPVDPPACVQNGTKFTGSAIPLIDPAGQKDPLKKPNNLDIVCRYADACNEPQPMIRPDKRCSRTLPPPQTCFPSGGDSCRPCAQGLVTVFQIVRGVQCVPRGT